MPIYLRQSTTSQEVPLGYFVDSTDGNTEETGLTIANTDIKVWKTGATTLSNKNSGGATHISNGIYYAVLDDTDTNTIGPLVIFVHVSGALAVRVECCVLDEALYDWMFGTTAPLMPTVSGRTLDVSSGGEAGVDWANIGSPTTTVNLSGTTVKTATDVETDTADIQSRLPAALVGGRIDANTGAISGDSVAADNLEAAADGTGYNLGGGSVVAASVTGAVGSVTGAVGSVTGNVGGNVTGSVGSVVGAVGSVTGNVGGNVTGTVGGLTAAALAQFFTTDTTKTYTDAVAGSVVYETAENSGGGGGSTTIPQIIGGVTKSGSTYYVTYALVLDGALQTSGLGTLSVTFYDEDGTDLTFSGTPAASAAGLIYASGTLGTAITDNRPVMVKVAVTKSAVAYSTVLPAVSIA